MDYFINLKSGGATLNTYRFADAQVTDMADLCGQHGNEDSQTLTVTLSLWIDSEVADLLTQLDKLNFDSHSDLRDYLEGEGDFLDRILDSIDIDHTQDPEIRAYHLSSFDDYSESKFDRPAY